MGYRFSSILYLHGYAVTKIKTTFAAQPPPLRVVSSEQVAHNSMQPTRSASASSSGSYPALAGITHNFRLEKMNEQQEPEWLQELRQKADPRWLELLKNPGGAAILIKELPATLPPERVAEYGTDERKVWENIGLFYRSQQRLVVYFQKFFNGILI